MMEVADISAAEAGETTLRFDMAEKSRHGWATYPQNPAKRQKSSTTAFKKNAWRIPAILQIVQSVVIVIAHPLDEDMRRSEKICPFNNCSNCTPVGGARQVT